MASRTSFTVVDLFSGAGGMSAGFDRYGRFRVAGAADLEVGKPSDAVGALQCNQSYARNIGVRPLSVDLGVVEPKVLRRKFGLGRGELDVLVACPPCTGFSRAGADNHVRDDPRNGLVVRTAAFVEEFRPRLLVMENARELLTGRFVTHFQQLREKLASLDYAVEADVYLLSDFGLPQRRERAILIAVASGSPRTLEDLWRGWSVDPAATTVRRALAGLSPLRSGETSPDDPNHTTTALTAHSLARIAAVPRNGGSWRDLQQPKRAQYLTPAMLRAIDAKQLNRYSDIYGRMRWESPAPTIKRECTHPGNGRYAHPEEDRLCSVREMARLQGFPDDFVFVSTGRKSTYRQVGDAVPPLISHQLAALCAWMLGDERPTPEQAVLGGVSLNVEDIAVSTLVDTSERTADPCLPRSRPALTAA